jgi:hypothetical protein
MNPCGTLCSITPKFEKVFVVGMRKSYFDKTMINLRKK